MSNMKTKSTTIVLFWSMLVIWAGSVAYSQIDSEESDPVLTYYWNKAAEKAPTVDPGLILSRYRCAVLARRFRIDSDGRLGRADSVLVDMFLTGNTLDSQKVIRGDIDKIGDIELQFPSPFANEYRLNFFPNDTGGEGLAIGLVSDSSLANQPDGLIVIDRREYYLRSLYLYYPEKSGYKRFTRTYNFQLVDGVLFPSEIVEIATKMGIFISSTYRMELEISGVELLK